MNQIALYGRDIFIVKIYDPYSAQYKDSRPAPILQSNAGNYYGVTLIVGTITNSEIYLK